MHALTLFKVEAHLSGPHLPKLLWSGTYAQRFY